MAKLYRELAGQTIIYGLGTIIPRILNFLLTPLYTYTLPEAQFGVITELYSYVAFFMVILTFGMETTFFRYSSLGNNKRNVFNNSFSVVLFISLLFIVLVLLFRGSIASFIHYSDYSYLIVLLAFIIFFDAITAIPLANLRLEGRAKFFTLIRTINVLINISLNIFFFVVAKNSSNAFISSFYNQNIGVGYAFISNLVASFFTFIVLLPSILKFRVNLDWVLLKKMIYYASPLLIVGFAGMINEVADKIFLKFLTPEYLSPLKQVGIYGANYKLAILMTIFIQMFKYAAEPFFFKQSSNIDAKIIYSKVMTWFVIFTLFIFLLVTLYIDIFKYFIGADYREGLKIVPIILLANMFLGIYYNLSVWYKLNNLTGYGALMSLFGVAITISLNFILIPKIGYLGSAYATFVCYFSMMLLSFYLGSHFYRVNYEVSKLLFYFVIAVILFFVNSYFSISAGVLSFLFSTFLMFVFFLVVYKKESLNFESLKSFIKK